MYWLLKACMKLAIRCYFRKVTVQHFENIPNNAPVILAPNHPSAFMDPILVGTLLKRKTHFIARGESFQNKWVGWILSKLNMLPVYRPEKTRHLVHKNKGVFKACYKILESNGCIIIFPEGLSRTELTLRKIKTGTARMALGAENENNFDLNVHIVPVGLNYSNPHKFRSDVEIKVGKPIPVKNYKSLYQTSRQKAVRLLTDHIKNEIADKAAHLEDPGKAGVAHNLFKVLSFKTSSHEYENATMHQIVGMLNKAKPTTTEKLGALSSEFMHIVERLKIDSTIQSKRTLNLWNSIWKMPLSIVGMFINFLPYKITGWITDVFIRRPDFRGSFLLVMGFFIFTSYYLSMMVLAAYLTGNILFVLLTVPVGLITGVVFLSFKADFIDWYRNRQLNYIMKEYNGVYKDLESIQVQIREILAALGNSKAA